MRGAVCGAFMPLTLSQHREGGKISSASKRPHAASVAAPRLRETPRTVFSLIGPPYEKIEFQAPKLSTKLGSMRPGVSMELPVLRRMPVGKKNATAQNCTLWMTVLGAPLYALQYGCPSRRTREDTLRYNWSSCS